MTLEELFDMWRTLDELCRSCGRGDAWFYQSLCKSRDKARDAYLRELRKVA